MTIASVHAREILAGDGRRDLAVDVRDGLADAFPCESFLVPVP